MPATMTPTTLAERIDKAAADGAITAARSRRAHENIRVLGNDVLHDEWREVTEAEFDQAHDSTSVKAPAIMQPSALAKRAMASRSASSPSPDTPCFCVETLV